MADRQSQGLQIALIVAVMLDIVFGVVAYLMWRQFDEAKTAAATALKDKGTADAGQKTAQEEARLLKEWMGFANTESKDAIQKVKDADMTAYEDAFPKGYPAADRVYRKVVKSLYDVVKARDKTIADLQASLSKADADLAATRSEAAAKAAAEEKATADARSERETQRKEFASQLALVRAERTTLEEAKSAEAAQAAAQAAQLQNEVAAREARIGDLGKRYKDEKDKVEGLRKETFEVPTGKVISVDQAQGIVYINLGAADSLLGLTKFAVYDANTSDVSQGGRKATIEVTKVIGPHQAAAHIVDNNYGNPVLSGDVIYTPVWRPGQKRHFALVGLMDVDGDKHSDLELVRNLIATNGGVVDSYRDMDSIVKSKNVRVGKMTPDTDYLIVGSEPDPGTEADRADFTDMYGQAGRDLVKKITLRDFLDKIGYRSETTLQKFGPGYRAQDFQLGSAGVQQTNSGGNISPLFRPRNVPAGAQQVNPGGNVSPLFKSGQPAASATEAY
jgi:hypothetical protein